MNGFIDYENVVCMDELAYRCNANFSRLEGKRWRAETISTGDISGWPGDWEGRTILALVLLSQSTHRRAAYLDEIMGKLPDLLNENHYFGKLLDTDCIDEQQLSGNSWFLRSMCEYHQWKKDDFSLMIIRDIVEHLILPCKGYYREYPLDSTVRQRTGDMAGTLFDGIDGNWKLSSDNGCAFIMIDGASHAYQILGDPRLKEVLDEMIEKFLSADLLKDEFQTHATLSATRGILRLYLKSGEPFLLEKAKKIYALYKEKGMTENYANYNWFGRPDTWTEPCAIIDSMIASMTLWSVTGEADYVRDANNIYYNAMGHAQRPNGGFGCDQCSAVQNTFLESHVDIAADAYWCCSMRGGEGLSKAVSYHAYLDGERICFPFYGSAEIRLDTGSNILELSEESKFLTEGRIRFTITKTTFRKEVALSFFLPEWADPEEVELYQNGFAVKNRMVKGGFFEVSLPLQKGDILEICYPIKLRKVPVQTSEKFKGYVTLRHGGIILGANTKEIYAAKDILRYLDYEGNGVYKNRQLDITLEPINNVITMSTDEARENVKQILFWEE